MPPEKVEMSARAQRDRDAAVAAEQAATRKVIWTVSVIVALIVIVAVTVTVITKTKAKNLRDRTRWLEQKYEEVVSQYGSFDDTVADELSKQAIYVGFAPSVIRDIRQRRFLAEVQPIKDRIADALMLTDEDKAEIDAVSHKHAIKVDFDENMTLCRNIFLIERDDRLPPPMQLDLMLEPGEEVYASIPSVWQETRIVSQGYVGSSISIPTGIEGVRFRFGGYRPVKTEQVVPVSVGKLHVTSERLLFRGESRNTSIKLKRIIDGQIYFDGSALGLRIDKDQGKPDFFAMSSIQARYTLSLIGAMRRDAQKG